jgi:hypothetical protein
MMIVGILFVPRWCWASGPEARSRFARRSATCWWPDAIVPAARTALSHPARPIVWRELTATSTGYPLRPFSGSRQPLRGRASRGSAGALVDGEAAKPAIREHAGTPRRACARFLKISFLALTDHSRFREPDGCAPIVTTHQSRRGLLADRRSRKDLRSRALDMTSYLCQRRAHRRNRLGHRQRCRRACRATMRARHPPGREGSSRARRERQRTASLRGRRARAVSGW